MPISRAGNSLPTPRPGRDARASRLRPRAGFTLLELIVTLAVIAAVSALAVPAIAARLLEPPSARTARAAAGLAAQARRLAAERGVPASLRWLPAVRRLELVAGTGEPVAGFAVSDDVEVAARGLLYVAAPERVNVSAAEIVFFPGGGSTGGRFEIRPRADVGSTSARPLVVLVDPLTGYVGRRSP